MEAKKLTNQSAIFAELSRADNVYVAVYAGGGQLVSQMIETEPHYVMDLMLNETIENIQAEIRIPDKTPLGNQRFLFIEKVK